MNKVMKQPYELSVWQDYWDDSRLCYVDKKIAIVGKNEESWVYQAQNVTLTRNINGTSTLSFSMYYKYYDEFDNQLKDNPFITLMTNERKIKIKYGEKWNFQTDDWDYQWKDFFIKTVQEASDKKSVNYTCKDAFITELSKTGFTIELDPELENNQGTITQLGQRVLEGTDWTIGSSELLREKAEDYLYERKPLASFTAYSSINNTPVTVSTSGLSLLYYDCITKKTPRLQLLYSTDGSFKVDEQRIVEAEGYYVDVTYTESSSELSVFVGGVKVFSISSTLTVSQAYKGMRFVRQPKTLLDPVTDRFVTLYTANGNTVYGYTTTEYLEPLTVFNMVTNNRHMTSSSGWYAYGNSLSTLLPYVPQYTGNDMPIYLRVQLASGQTRFFNTGVSDNRGLLSEGVAAGEEWTLRMKYRSGTDDGPQSGLTAVVAKYNTVTQTYAPADVVFTFNSFSTVNGYAQGSASASREITQAELFGTTDKYGIFFIGSSGQQYFLEDIQLFKKVLDTNNQQVYPDTISVEPAFRFLYSYYKPEPTVTQAEDVRYLYKGYQPWSSATVQYSDDFEKIRSITASKSNSFNLIQQLAETFQCWAQFHVGHNSDGSLELVQRDGIWSPNKQITFVEFLGQEHSLGFSYGINLKSIQRNVESEQIVTKLIVEPNANEFAPSGFCTIAYADDNLSKEGFIYNFDYFVQLGLLDGNELLRDLYVTVGAEKGYLAALRDLNESIKNEQDVLPAVYRSIDQQNYLIELYTAMLEESTTLATQTRANILQLTKYTNTPLGFDQAMVRISSPNATETEKRYYNEYNTYKANIATATTVLGKARTSLANLETQIETIQNTVENLVQSKKVLNLKFYKRYSRFIQEGSWIDENYMDHNLYYLDAQSVLYNSAFPKISYTINVIDLIALSEYRHYGYSLGDKTTIEDVEFFGYSDHATKTPYKEQVIISEITTNFSSPLNSKIVIQNFKSQFQDLFQRITATTNSLQYHTGEYKRAAATVGPNGEFNIETLQNSLVNNSLIVASAQNDSFIVDSNGITLVDLDNPLSVVKIQSKGVFLSQDGGVTWTIGLRGGGINTQALTAGSLLVDKIFIQGAGDNAFRWDEYGINAYANNALGGRNQHSFVRFDNYGLYGISDETLSGGEYVPSNEDDIWNTAKFGMTWKGFFVRNRYGNGWVEVSSENDFAVYDGIAQRIKLGNLGAPSAPVYGLVVRDELSQDRVRIGNIGTYASPSYGLIIRDFTGDVGMMTNESGQLYAEHLYIGPRLYQARAELGVLTPYISDTPASEILPYRSDGLYQAGDVVSYGGSYYKAASSVVGFQTLPTPGTTGDWVATTFEYTKILSITNLAGEETVSLFDNGKAIFNEAVVHGSIVATSGTIGGLPIRPDSLEGFGFTIGSSGIAFDITENAGGFRLFRQTGGIQENVFSIVDNELVMVGSGTFTGTIHAKDSVFEGTVEANSGSIGGLIIASNSLRSSNESFSIDSTGHVVAESIELGSSAKIRDYLQLGNSFIYNPDRNQNHFITVTDGLDVPVFTLDNLGMMTLGKGDRRIYLDGANSVIQGNSWRITPDLATFMNVSVSGTIHTAVFDKGSVQSINSALILSISNEVRKSDFDTKTIWVDYEENAYEVGDWVVVADDTNQVALEIAYVAEPDEENLIALNFEHDELGNDIITPTTLTKLGKEGTFHIGLNSSNASLLSLFSSRALSMGQLVVGDDGLSVKTDYRLILGKLTGVEQITPYLPDANERYGLYADFAFIRGSIVSESLEDEEGYPTYSGINTLNGAQNKNPVNGLFDTPDLQEETSKIVFWAGASGLTSTEINDAPFKVTERGYIYAKQGVFEGSVFSDSVITNSVIVAKSIFTAKNSSALHIYDTDYSGTENVEGVLHDVRGIIFSTDRRNGSQDSIEEEGNHLHRVGLDVDGIRFYSDEDRDNRPDEMGIYVPEMAQPMIGKSGVARLTLVEVGDRLVGGNQIRIVNDSISFAEKGVDSYYNRLAFTGESISFDFDGASAFKVEKERVDVSKEMHVGEVFTLGDNIDNYKQLAFKRVAGGVDVYVGG